MADETTESSITQRTVRSWGSDKVKFTRNLAVIIGIDRYEKAPAIRNLTTAVRDAKAIAELLKDQYEYKPEGIIELTDEKATFDGLRDLFQTRLRKELNPTGDDRLIIYFAGHGLAHSSQEGQDGPEGYLVPYNADPTKPELFLAMREVYQALEQLECHHLLVILDCCFAGTFRWAGSRASVPILETIRQEHYYHFIRHPAWQVITSSAHDQTALDVAQLKEDDRQPEGWDKPHSPFALAFLEALQPGDDPMRLKGDLFPDGVVTAHELFVYLQNRVKELSNKQQAPGIYPLRRDYDKGEFVFTPLDFNPQKLAKALPLNEDNNPYRGLNSFDEKHARLFFGRQALIDELFKRLSLPNQSLTVVLGVSGSGKSSLVKAGLIPHLRNQKTEQHTQQWYIVDPMRPGKLPFISLARSLLPIVKDSLLERLAEVSFLDKIFHSMLKPEAESNKDSNNVHEDEQEGNSQATQPSLQADETIIKLADSWYSATPEAKLLLIEDYFAQLVMLCDLRQKEHLKALYDKILAELDSVSQNLQKEPQYFSDEIATWSQKHPGVRLLLVIDQFEELLTRSQDDHESHNQTEQQEGDRPSEREWQRFLEALRIAIVEHAQTLRLVLTLRSDFEPRFLSSALDSYWKDARFPVRVMTSDELRQAIENPALKQALYFEELKDDKGNLVGNLVSKLVDEVGQMPGALPLLSFTLSELYVRLYQRWKDNQSTDRTLRFVDYEDLGGVAGALTRRATQEYNALVDKNYQATMQRVMLRMVTIEGGRVARRRVPMDELRYPFPDEDDRVKKVIECLINARLVVKGQEIDKANTASAVYIEPAHDFLVTGWGKLQDWIKKEQDNLVLRQRLTVTANAWIRREGSLWVEEADRLIKLNEIINSNKNWLNRLETVFVKRSSKVRQDRLKKLEKDLRISERRRAIAEIREKAARAENLLQVQPLDALILAIQAIGQNLEELPEEILAHAQMSLYRAMKTAKVAIPLHGHEQNVSAVAFSPDGKLIVSGSVDNTVRLWDTQGNSIGEPLRGHKNYVSSVAFSPNGKIIASSSYDNTVRLWDIQGNSIGEPLRGHEGAVKSVAFHPDGLIVVSGGEDSTVRLWDIQGNPIGEPLCGHEGAVYSIALSRNGQMIASSGADATVRLWNIQGNPIGEPFRGHQHPVLSIAFSPNGRMIVSNGADGIARLWDIQGKLIDELLWKVGGIQSYSPGTTFSFGGQFEKPVTFDMPLWAKEGFVYSVAFSPDGQMIAIGSEDNIIRLWDIRGDWIGGFFQGHEGAIISLAVSPDRQMIASSGEDKTVRLWTMQGNLASKSFHTPQEIKSLAFSSDSQKLLGCGDVGAVYLWDLQGNLIDDPFHGYGHFNEEVAFSPDGYVMVSKGGVGDERVTPEKFIVPSKNAICFWDDEGCPIGEPIEISYGTLVKTVAFSPNGQMLASSDYNGRINFWDTHGYLTCKTAQGHESNILGSVTSITFSPDGQMVVSGGKEKTVRLWDLQGNLLCEPLRGHEDYVRSVVFSPDGKIIASSSNDGTIRLWDTQGNPIGEPLPLQGLAGAFSVTSTVDGRSLIISGSSDGTLQFWRGGWRAWLEVCCDRLRYHQVFKDPETEAQKFACKTCCIQRGRTLAIEGDIEAAIIEFKTALIFDSDLKVDPEFEARRLRAMELIEQGKAQALRADISGVITKFEEALKLDASLQLNPQAEARQLMAELLVKNGKWLAGRGCIEKAITRFEQAQELDLNLDLNLLIEEANQLSAPYLLKKGKQLVKEGKLNEAIKAYSAAMVLDPRLEFDSMFTKVAEDWNSLCWFGSFHGYATDPTVMAACESAVRLEPESESYRDSRGVARALTGNFQGAIEDFQYYIDHTDYEVDKAQRQRWLEALNQGENPFTSDEINKLLNE